MTELPDPGAFGTKFEAFMRAMTLAADRGESEMVGRLRESIARRLRA